MTLNSYLLNAVLEIRDKDVRYFCGVVFPLETFNVLKTSTRNPAVKNVQKTSIENKKTNGAKRSVFILYYSTNTFFSKLQAKKESNLKSFQLKPLFVHNEPRTSSRSSEINSRPGHICGKPPFPTHFFQTEFRLFLSPPHVPIVHLTQYICGLLFSATRKPKVFSTAISLTQTRMKQRNSYDEIITSYFTYIMHKNLHSIKITTKPSEVLLMSVEYQ